MQARFDDPRLRPIAGKVMAGERLSFDDGLSLYRSPDLLGIGYLANHVREQLNGDTTYFNVNRHINPTNVCVAACKLCAFGRQVRNPQAYTMSLDQVWEVAGQGYVEAVSEFHIVGGLHPELSLDWFCEMISGLRQRYPHVHLKAFTMVEIGYLARRAQALDRRDPHSAEGGRRAVAPRRRRGDLQRASPPYHLRPQDRRRRVDFNRPHRASDRLEVECDDALRPHRDRRRPS